MEIIFTKPDNGDWEQHGSLMNFAKQHGATKIGINGNESDTKGVATLIKSDGTQKVLPLGSKAAAKWSDLTPKDLIVQHLAKGNDGKPVTIATLAGGGGNVFDVEDE